MSYDTWVGLTPHAQRLSRYIVCDKGEPVIGEGISHPRRSERERIRAEQLEAMDHSDAIAYERRA